MTGNNERAMNYHSVHSSFVILDGYSHRVYQQPEKS